METFGTSAVVPQPHMLAVRRGKYDRGISLGKDTHNRVHSWFSNPTTTFRSSILLVGRSWFRRSAASFDVDGSGTTGWYVRFRAAAADDQGNAECSDRLCVGDIGVC